MQWRNKVLFISRAIFEVWSKRNGKSHSNGILLSSRPINNKCRFTFRMCDMPLNIYFQFFFEFIFYHGIANEILNWLQFNWWSWCCDSIGCISSSAIDDERLHPLNVMQICFLINEVTLNRVFFLLLPTKCKQIINNRDGVLSFTCKLNDIGGKMLMWYWWLFQREGNCSCWPLQLNADACTLQTICVMVNGPNVFVLPHWAPSINCSTPTKYNQIMERRTRKWKMHCKCNRLMQSFASARSFVFRGNLMGFADLRYETNFSPLPQLTAFSWIACTNKLECSSSGATRTHLAFFLKRKALLFYANNERVLPLLSITPNDQREAPFLLVPSSKLR